MPAAKHSLHPGQCIPGEKNKLIVDELEKRFNLSSMLVRNVLARPAFSAKSQVVWERRGFGVGHMIIAANRKLDLGETT